MYGLSGFSDKLKIQNCVNSKGNCVHLMYEMSGFAKKLSIYNFENLARDCVNYICTKCLDLNRNLISTTA